MRKSPVRKRSTKRWKWFREFGLPTASAIAASLVLTTGGFLYSQLTALKDLPRWRTEVETWRKTADVRQQQLETWQQEARHQTQLVESLKTKAEVAENRLQNLQTEIVEVRTRVEGLRDLLRPSARMSATLELPPPVRDVSQILAASPGVVMPSAAPVKTAEPFLVAANDTKAPSRYDEMYGSTGEVRGTHEPPVRTAVFRPIVIGGTRPANLNHPDTATRRSFTDLSMLRGVRSAYGH